MPNQNVKLVKGIYEAFARGELAADAFDLSVVWHGRADLPDAQVAYGLDSVSAMVARWVDSFENFRADVHEYIKQGDAVIVPLTVRGRIAGTGNEVTMDETHIWTVRDGRVSEVREYHTREEALESLEARD